MAQLADDKKPEAIKEKIVAGKLDKIISGMALLEQPFVKDPSKTIEELIKEKIASIGEKITVRRFTKYTLGEGLEKRQDNFAEEVMSQIK